MIFHVNPLLKQRIHMKLQALFSLKDKSKKILVLSAAILLSSLRVKIFKCIKKNAWGGIFKNLYKAVDKLD